jgi:hypothetical protein
MITLFVLELDSEGTDKFGHFPVVFLYFSQVRKNTVQFSQSFIQKFFTVFMLNCQVQVFHVVRVDLEEIGQFLFKPLKLRGFVDLEGL